ncbi:MAG: hypothetical protein HDQ96_06370 [Lachnospiraceae bacterium]|nr:hypothetical protein [Lachnospiraceae bacterium]
MRIFQKELYKVYAGRKFILVILLFIGVNAALLYTSTNSPMVRPEAYKKVYTHIETLPVSERADYIRNCYYDACEADSDMEASTDSAMENEYFLFRELYAQLEQIENYPNYLQDIQDRAKNASGISIFNLKDPFSIRNAEKTAKAFQPLEGNALQFTNTNTFVEATDFLATDFFLIALLFYVVVILVVQEKEKGLFALVKPLSCGRSHLMCVKMGVLFFSVFFFTLLFWGGNLMITTFKYGAVNMGAFLQSIGGYTGSALNVTILQYWILFLFSKMLIYFLIGLLLFYFALASNSVVMLYVRSVLLFSLSFVLYWAIDGNSAFQLLKYMNIANFVQVTPVYQYYFNLNIFSRPVNIVWVFAFSCTLFCVIVFFLNLYTFKSQDSVLTLKSRTAFRKKLRKRCHTSLSYHESYKLYVVQKALWILILFVCLQGYLFMQKEPYIGATERYYKNYMQTLQGEVTDKTRGMIAREEERLASFTLMRMEAEQNFAEGSISSQEYDAIQKLVDDNTKGQEAFTRVLEHFAYVEEQGRETGEIPWMVYETGYEKLTGNSYIGYEDDMKNAAMILVVMIAAFAAFFSTEYSTGMIHMISCYKLGRENTVKAKLRVAFPLYTVLFLSGYVPDFIAVCNQYGLPCRNAELISIPALSGFPIDMKLWQYLVLLYTYRYIVFLCILLFIFMFSTFLKDTGTAMLILSIVLVIPTFLHIIGLRWIDYFSLNAFVSGNIVLNNFRGRGYALLLLFPIALGVFSYTRLLRVYSVSK